VPRFLFRGAEDGRYLAHSADGYYIESLPYKVGQKNSGKINALEKASLADLPYWDKVMAQSPLPEVAEDIFVVPGLQGMNYYHTLVNSLPTLNWYRQLGLDCPIYFPFDILKRYPIFDQILDAILSMLDIPRARLINSGQARPVIYRRAYIPAPIPRYDAEVALFHHDLATHVMDHLVDGTETSRFKRVYISRQDSDRRSFLNEAELIESLKERDFHIVELSRLPFAQQVALMRNAEFIVAPHGAGLTNLGFCRPGTQLLELITLETSLTFLRPAAFKGLSYFCFSCTLAPDCDPATAKTHQGRWQVDIPRLLRVLDRLDPRSDTSKLSH